MARRRVVVTGMGTVTPHADDVGALFAQLLAGVSAVRRIASFEPAGLPSQIAAEVRYDFDAPTQIGPYPVRSRTLRLAAGAAARAIADAGIGELPPDHPGRARRAVHVSTGVGSTALDAMGPVALATWGPDGERDMVALRAALGARPDVTEHLQDWFCDLLAPAIATLFCAGRASTAASACASGSHAILDGLNLIRAGRADTVLVGGVCSPVTRSMMPGFAMLSALSTRNDAPERASRPFDADREGFVMGEGCSMLVLEELGAALARGARIHGEVLGAGIATDSYRLTDPEPTGRGMGEAMQGALRDAGRTAEDVDYVNAHGTSTKLNDAAETKALKRVLGDRARRVPISSCKSMFGHLIHAAGATEAIVCFRSIATSRLTPTINYETPDPDCDLDYVPNEARDHRSRLVLNNSFGFGGQNVSLALAAWDGSRP